MAERFKAVPASADAVASLSALYPENVFATSGYFAARSETGDKCWVLGLYADDGSLVAGCGAFVRIGRFNRSMETASLPVITETSAFWDGLRTFCREQSVTLLELGTYGSPAAVGIPEIGLNFKTRERCEYVVDLQKEVMSGFGSNHKRNVKRGQKSGLSVQRSRSLDSVPVHERLMSLSMNRRRERGEEIAYTPSPDIVAYIRHGAGEFFQAVSDGVVMSSVLVLRSAAGAYYQTAGTSPEGMAAGASHFLIHQIAETLRDEGLGTFNLGGGDEASSLARFKEGFGSRPIRLQAAESYVGTPMQRKIGRLIALATTERYKLRQLLVGHRIDMRVYQQAIAAPATPPVAEGLQLQRLSADDLRALATDDAEFKQRQLNRLARFGESYAYAVLADGTLSHISWLLPAKAIVRDEPAVLAPDDREYEITCCETLPGFRGRGIYPFAIGNLISIASQNGARRVLMKTTADNKPSQTGIERAGLQDIGTASLITLPVVGRTVVRRRYK